MQNPHAVWEKTAHQIDRLADKLGHPIDKGIKETVIALNVLGIHTVSSCEGHANWGVKAPYVDVESTKATKLNEKLEKTQADSKAETALLGEITQINLRERKKLLELLTEFYKQRKTSYEDQLHITSFGLGISRLQSIGADLQEIRDTKTVELKLRGYKLEMSAFTEFLKEKIFADQSINLRKPKKLRASHKTYLL